MLPPSNPEDCDDCVPAYLKHNTFGPRAAFSTLPFIATFVLLTFFAYRKVYPLLSTHQPARHQKSIYAGLGKRREEPASPEVPTQGLARRIAAITFSSTIALSAVLTELLLCEISNSFNPTARSLSLQVTVASLLGLLVVAIPLLGIYSVVSRSGYKFRGPDRGRLPWAWVLELTGYAVFLLGFWTIGALLPHTNPKGIEETLKRQKLFQACLDRLGITGVSLMALLSGFASISSVWQNFGPKVRPVAETDISRKQAGLDATLDMIAEKQERLGRLQQKISGAPAPNFWTRTVGSIRGGGADVQEQRTLEMEIQGLETMADSLDSSLSMLRARRTEQLRSTTTFGRISIAFSYVFSCYCIYRIFTTILNISRHAWHLSSSSMPSSKIISSPTQSQLDDPTTDPVTFLIALIARHIYPTLDQASWTHQISFLLSGAILLASFNAVTQTFHLVARLVPARFLPSPRSNSGFALLISQIAGMYVISSALMLRGLMPQEVGGVINEALGNGKLEIGWVQGWFDVFFMISVIATGVGIWGGRVFGKGRFEDDDYGVWDDGGGGVEMGFGLGKRA